jgi:hypothetical protein
MRSIKNQGREARLNDDETHMFGARRANVTGLDAWEPHLERLVLPKSIESSNTSVNKPVIRGMSA